MIGNHFIELQSIESTNNYALELIHANLAQAGTCIFTHEQTKGRGQMGKIWITEKDVNLLTSIIVKTDQLQGVHPFALSVCTALATHDFFAKYAGDETKIKWPNDLYWRDRKAGGILIDNVMRGNSAGTLWQWTVVGIGININQASFSDDLKNPVSLKQITGNTFDTILLAKELYQCFDIYFQLLLQNKTDLLFAQYKKILLRMGEKVKLKKGSRVFEALIKDVDMNGELVIQHAVEEKITMGEVEWLL